MSRRLGGHQYPAARIGVIFGVEKLASKD
jgi:hypothetical protein